MYQQGYRIPQQQPTKHRPEPAKKRGMNPLIKVALVLLAIAILVFGAYFLKIHMEVKPFESVYLNNIYIDGIHLGGMTPAQAQEAVFNQLRTLQNSWSLSLQYGDHVYYTLTYDTMGIRADEQQAYALLNQALQYGHTGNTFDRKADMDMLSATPFMGQTTRSAMTDEWLDSILSQIAADLYRYPSDAYLVSFNPNLDDPFTVQKEVYGQQLDVKRVKATILDCLNSGTSGTLQLTPDPLNPRVTEKDVRSGITLLGKAITPISEDSIENRTNNVRVALSRYNGMIVEPGQNVSFNRVVGERSFQNGFYAADEFVSGNLTTGIGGGVCQASTTVYIAALLSNLEIVDREPHSDVVSYSTFGQDATVYWSYGRKIDFVFKNSTKGNIYITAEVEEYRKNRYQCVVRIYGQSQGDNVTYKLDTRTVQEIPAPLMPEYIKDNTLLPGEEKLVRKARDGFINETYLQRWENGSLVSETFVSRDTCLARAAQYKVGPTVNP